MTTTVQVYKDGVLVTEDASALAPPPVISPVPQQVTQTQGMLALNAAGLLAQVQSAVAASPEATQIWFNTANVWERGNPIILALGVQLGLTSVQIDALFVQAAAL